MSSVLSALSTLDFMVGSMSGTLIENPRRGFFSLSEMLIQHSTVLRVLTDVVSAISVDREAFVL